MSSGELDVSLFVQRAAGTSALSVLMSEFVCVVNSDTCRSETGGVSRTALVGGSVLVMTKMGICCFRNGEVCVSLQEPSSGRCIESHEDGNGF